MNNRQANGRRRGRGGQQRQGGNPSQGNGNRIDNRARGNAAQLLEKYKNLARDAQMQGDRVNTEYYLQFADHYFRVLSDQRSRYEDNQQQHQRRGRDDEDGDDYEMEAEGNSREAADQGEERGDDRPQHRNGHANGNGGWQGDAEGEEEAPRAERQPRRGRPRREEAATDAKGGIDAAVLPPAIAAEEAPAAEEKPKPRRGRPRRDAEASA